MAHIHSLVYFFLLWYNHIIIYNRRTLVDTFDLYVYQKYLTHLPLTSMLLLLKQFRLYYLWIFLLFSNIADVPIVFLWSDVRPHHSQTSSLSLYSRTSDMHYFYTILYLSQKYLAHSTLNLILIIYETLALYCYRNLYTNSLL